MNINIDHIPKQRVKCIVLKPKVNRKHALKDALKCTFELKPLSGNIIQKTIKLELLHQRTSIKRCYKTTSGIRRGWYLKNDKPCIGS